MARSTGSVKVTVPQFEKQFEKILNEELSRVSAPIRWGLQEEAQNKHRYTVRNQSDPRPHLRESTIASGSLGKEERGVRKITLEARAYHAPFVIGGHGTWKPDPFIDNALRNKKSWAIDKVNEAIRRVVDRVNKG